MAVGYILVDSKGENTEYRGGFHDDEVQGVILEVLSSGEVEVSPYDGAILDHKHLASVLPKLRALVVEAIKKPESWPLGQSGIAGYYKRLNAYKIPMREPRDLLIDDLRSLIEVAEIGCSKSLALHFIGD